MAIDYITQISWIYGILIYFLQMDTGLGDTYLEGLGVLLYI